jgi:NADH-quinone oxidoreductase subunit J
VDPINWNTFFFYLFGLVASLFALGVMFTSNVVHMAFYLVISLSATSGLFFLAGADFVGAMQILIYVGGTLVLLVFGVMLTAQKRFVSMKTRGHEWVIAAAVGGSLFLALVWAAFAVPGWSEPATHEPTAQEHVTATRLAVGLLGGRVDQGDQADQSLQAGMSGYLLPFEIISVHLLVVLIGAAYLARAKRRAQPSASAG